MHLQVAEVPQERNNSCGAAECGECTAYVIFIAQRTERRQWSNEYDLSVFEKLARSR